MNIERLRKRGWSEEEIAHALGIFQSAEEKKHPKLKLLERTTLYLACIMLVVGTIALALEIAPFLLLAHILIVVPIMFTLGACFGFFFVHVLRQLRLADHHQHLSAAILTASALFLVAIVTTMLESRIGLATNAFVIALAFAAGIFVPYLMHRRAPDGTL